MKVLVADDSPVLRKAVAGLLRAGGFEVEEAADGAEAIELLLSKPPDAVLLDLHMPRVTGWVVCRLMKEDPALCRIPVMVLTVLDGPEDRFWAEKSGADGYVTKDQIDGTLLERLHAMLAGRALSDLSVGAESRGADGPVDVLARVCEVLDRKLFEATVVNEVASVALRSLDLRESLGEVLTAVGRAVGYDVGAVALLSERVVAVRCAHPVAAASLEAFYAGVARALDELSGTGLTLGDLAVVSTCPDVIPDQSRPCTWASRLVFPLQARGRVVGALVLAAAAPERFDERVQRTLRAVTPAVAMVVEGAREYQRAIAEEVEAGLSSL